MEQEVPFETVESKTFGPSDTVVLDGKSFIGCIFDGCEFIYGGGDVAHKGCSFSGRCRLNFVGAAHRTVTVLQWCGYKIISPFGENPEAKYFQ